MTRAFSQHKGSPLARSLARKENPIPSHLTPSPTKRDSPIATRDASYLRCTLESFSASLPRRKRRRAHAFHNPRRPPPQRVGAESTREPCARYLRSRACARERLRRRAASKNVPYIHSHTYVPIHTYIHMYMHTYI